MNRYIDEDGVEWTREEFKSRPHDGRRFKVVLCDFEPSIVDESQAADADLNVLVKRWTRGEPVPQFAPAQFGDVTVVKSFQDMQDKLLVVQNAFLSLPAHVRERFRNSAVDFADAMVDPSRVDELVELGILEKPEEPKPPVEAAPAKPAVAPPEGAGPGDGGSAAKAS